MPFLLENVLHEAGATLIGAVHEPPSAEQSSVVVPVASFAAAALRPFRWSASTAARVAAALGDLRRRFRPGVMSVVGMGVVLQLMVPNGLGTGATGLRSAGIMQQSAVSARG
jgi:hypothetical protein